MINVIDIGTSNIRSYLISDGKVVSLQKQPNIPIRLVDDTLKLFDKNRDLSQSTIVLSTSDSVVWEDTEGNVQWEEHAHPECWMDGLPPYEVSGHPRYEPLRGAANQMLSLADNVGFENIRRILPVSAMVAAQIAQNENWNTWDYTHASNSGFYNYYEGRWADAAKPFIDAGVIAEKILPPIAKIPSDPSMRHVYLGGHDSVFTNAMDIPYSTTTYISCGTWTTLSTPTLLRNNPDYPSHIPIDGDDRNRYVLAPNGVVLKQRCFLSETNHQDTIGRIFEFLDTAFRNVSSVPCIKIFGTWSGEIVERLAEIGNPYRFEGILPHSEFGCVHLPLKAVKYIQTKDASHFDNQEYYCEGA